jgi:ribosomal protein S1
MSSIIQPVTYNEEESKSLLQKLSEHLGIHKMTVCLSEGDVVEGIISEIGKDYLILLDHDGNTELMIPTKNIKYFQYSA